MNQLVLLETIQNKAVLNALVRKWFGNEYNEQNIQTTKKYIESFTNIKNKLSLKSAEVKTFLHKFTNFDPKYITDISRYSLDEIKFIVNEFSNEDTTDELNDFDKIFKGKNLEPNKELYEASKKLWYGNNKLIINEDGFRVYSITDRKTAINFGYYVNYLIENKPFSNRKDSNQWCITRHRVDYNMWSNYRDNRTFYFVIDESKSPKNDFPINISQYYISVLQYDKTSATKYRLTPILNDGSDPVVSPEDIYEIYPKMKGHLDSIVPINYNPKLEVAEETDVINLINEQPGNKYEFSILPKTYKKQFIDRGKILLKLKSWETLTDELKRLYINTTTEKTVFEKFSSGEIMSDIRKDKQMLRTLDVRLQILGFDGISVLSRKFIEEKYKYARKGKKNKNIMLFVSKITNLYGIFDSLKGDWLEKDGIVYDGGFKRTNRFDVEDDENDKEYTIFEYISDENKKFYTITDDDDTEFISYILSEKSYNKIKDRFIERPSELNPENDVDLGENESYK